MVSPSNATIASGGSQAYTAEGFDAGNNSLGDVTATTTFSITPDGSCVGATCGATVAGAHTVTGTNGTATDDASLAVFAGPLDHIVLSPATATITSGGSQAYTATSFDANNNLREDVTTSTVFTIAPNGSCTDAVCTATVAGAHTVTGTHISKTATASLTVNPGPLDHLVLSPATATITAGGSQTYTAEGFDAANNTLGDQTASTVFSITPDGSCTDATCTATAAGAHTVTGTKDGKTGTAALTVNPGPLDHLVLSPASATITSGGSQAFTAKGFDANDNDLGDVTASTVFSIAPNGSCTTATCTATVAGAHTVTGTKDGKTGTASLTVNPGPLDHLVLSPATATITSGGSQTYTAEGFDAANNTLGDQTASTAFSIAPNGSCTGATCTATTAGNHTVTGTKNGKTGTAGLVIKLSATPKPVAAGSPLSVSWFGIGAPSSTDWIGLYPSNATPDNSPSRVTFRFTNGAASGTLPLTVPSNTPTGPGYELRLFSNNTYTRLATAGPFTVQGPSLSATPNPVTPGTSLSVSWSGIAAPSSTDWIGLYPPGADDNSPSRITFKLTNGMSSGTISMLVPANTSPGPGHELRLFSNNTYTRLATLGSITIQAPSVSGSPNPVAAGTSLTVSWAGIVSPSSTDWIGLYPAGAGDNSPARVTFRMTTGAASGSLPMPVPTSAPPGAGYELRLFSNNTYTRLAVSGPITVDPVPPATLSATPSSIAPGNALSVSWSNIVAPSTTDWIGLYPSSTTPDNSAARVTFRMTDGMSAGALSLPVPTSAPPGPDYQLRLFSNNTYTRLATAGPLTVRAPSLSATPSSVAPGNSLSVSWADIAVPSSTDWIGLYPSSGTPDNSPSRITFRMTNGMSSGTLPLVVPTSTPPAAGYELRLFSNNTYTRLATAGPFTVRAPALSATPNAVTRGNSLTVTWADIAAPSSTDWIGLYPQGAGDSSPTRVTFQFTNGMASGTLQLLVPANTPPGTGYELRLFSNNTYTRLAVFGPITVQA